MVATSETPPEDKIVLRINILNGEYDIQQSEDPDNLIELICESYGISRNYLVQVLKEKSGFKNKSVKPKAATIQKHLISLTNEFTDDQYLDADSIFNCEVPSGQNNDEDSGSSGDEMYKTAIDKTKSTLLTRSERTLDTSSLR